MIDIDGPAAYVIEHEGSCKSFPISSAKPPASPGGLDAFASATLPGAPSRFKSEHATMICRPGRSYANDYTNSHS